VEKIVQRAGTPIVNYQPESEEVVLTRNATLVAWKRPLLVERGRGGGGCSTGPGSAAADGMEITCADCGCLVDRGIVVRPCERYPRCCCDQLPDRSAH